LILEAVRRMGDQAPTLVRVDLTTVSTLADVAGRLLRGASLGVSAKRARATAKGLAKAVGVSAVVEDDSRAGRLVARIEGSARALPAQAQRQILSSTLDALNALSEDLRRGVALALEGVERLPGLGGDDVLWQLREALGRQTHLRQIMTTADPDFTDSGVRADGPFAAWARAAHMGPIRSKRMATWIRETMESSGLRVTGGAVDEIMLRAGSRTGDIVRLASATVEAASGGKVARKTVSVALDSLADRMSGWFGSDWRAMTPRQQNLVRALAAGEIRPFAARVRKHYDLRSSAAVARSLELLMQKGLVYRAEQGYAVDNPFFTRWVERNALPDVGIEPSR